MSYIGLTSAAAYDPTRAAVPQLDAERFSGTGSATTFTLSRSVVTPVDIDVFVENVRQERQYQQESPQNEKVLMWLQNQYH